MTKPKIAGTRSIKVELKAGETKYWCLCGESTSQPFCDGSHQHTSFAPLAFTPEQDDTYSLCSCKRTSTPPFCDGTHRELTEDELADQ
ncbi:MAG: CDGSH iron-sulfur domain-containing protein [Gammaproteobacteria bacterium]